MTSEDMEDKYPHWKDALFGNHNAVANLRCAIHYVFWHGAYGLLAVLGVLLVGALKAGDFLAEYLGPLSEPVKSAISRVRHGIARFLNHDKTQAVAEIGFVVLFVVSLIACVVTLGWLFYTQFWMTVQALGILIGGVIGLILLFAIIERLEEPAANAGSALASGANRAGQKAVQTPGIRRVYGECPVSMDMAPRWFDNLFPEEEP
jgi:hypothetical protein